MHTVMKQEAKRIKNQLPSDKRSNAELDRLDKMAEHFPSDFLLIKKQIMVDILNEYVQ